MQPAAGPRVLASAEWRDLEHRHHERADGLTAGRRARAGTVHTDPVDDFLFTYYPFRPAQLRRWHPGAGWELEDAADTDRAGWKWYRSSGTAVGVDYPAYARANGRVIRFIVSLLSSTAARPASFGCFGLHEWAMVYRQDEHRHPAPLRLGRDATDAVVEANRIVCTHFDAFRFFTPAAVTLNRYQPTRENQPLLEQPGCLHAGMDVYKWAVKLGPLIPGELLLDCFELARDLRLLDMRASPYDLRDWGYSPIAIETPEGKAVYVQRQRELAERGTALRHRVVDAVTAPPGSTAAAD